MFKNMDKIKRALVLFEVSDYDTVKLFIDRLKKMGKEVYACGYSSKKNGGLTIPNCILLRQKEDTNWMSVPSKVFLSTVSQPHYDAVFDLIIGPNPAMEYLLAYVPCSFKVGLKKKDYPIHDFSIFIPSEGETDKDPLSVEYLGKQILHYLQAIHPGG